MCAIYTRFLVNVHGAVYIHETGHNLFFFRFSQQKLHDLTETWLSPKCNVSFRRAK